MSELPEFSSFYRAVNAGRDPLPWQARLADTVSATGTWPSEIAVPTGLGKTSCLDIALYCQWPTARRARQPSEQRRCRYEDERSGARGSGRGARSRRPSTRSQDDLVVYDEVCGTRRTRGAVDAGARRRCPPCPQARRGASDPVRQGWPLRPLRHRGAERVGRRSDGGGRRSAVTVTVTVTVRVTVSIGTDAGLLRDGPHLPDRRARRSSVEQCGADPLGSLALHRRGDVAVEVQEQRRVRVAEALCCDLWRDATREHHGRARMT